MTESDRPDYQQENGKNTRSTPLQIRTEGLYSTEEALHPSISAIAVVRPPKGIEQADMSVFYTRLFDAGILPISLPTHAEDPDDTYRGGFPTDHYREVGRRVLVSHDLSIHELYAALEANNKTRPFTSDLRARERQAGNLAGATFVNDEHSVTLIYDRADLNRYEKTSTLRSESDDALDLLEDDGWTIIPLDFTDQELTFNGIRKDFDNVVSSPFRGKNGETYMFIVQSLVDKFVNNDALRRTKINFLPVSEEEMIKGGCNIADLDRSRVLVCANRTDAPTVFSRLSNLAEARVIETPRGFLDGGGGPRCSISSISIR